MPGVNHTRINIPGDDFAFNSVKELLFGTEVFADSYSVVMPGALFIPWDSVVVHSVLYLHTLGDNTCITSRKRYPIHTKHRLHCCTLITKYLIRAYQYHCDWLLVYCIHQAKDPLYGRNPSCWEWWSWAMSWRHWDWTSCQESDGFSSFAWIP